MELSDRGGAAAKDFERVRCNNGVRHATMQQKTVESELVNRFKHLMYDQFNPYVHMSAQAISYGVQPRARSFDVLKNRLY